VDPAADADVDIQAPATVVEAVSTPRDERNMHPVLGPVISDFGYKRVHLVPAKTLASIAVWKKQRTFRHDRAKTMVKDKLKTPHLGFPGIIVLHEVSWLSLNSCAWLFF
jgi:hypothetical protein